MDDIELEQTGGVGTHDPGRRDFLKRSAVVGALAWSAPAITSLAGGRAWASTYVDPCPCESKSTGCIVRVFPLGTNIVLDKGYAVPPEPCVNELHTGPMEVGLGKTLQVDATTICADDVKAVKDINGKATEVCEGTASIQTLSISGSLLDPIGPIVATALTTQTNGQCDPAKGKGTTSLATLKIGDNDLTMLNACNHVVPLGPLGQLTINRHLCDPTTNDLTARALYVELTGVAEIIAAESIMLGTGACETC